MNPTPLRHCALRLLFLLLAALPATGPLKAQAPPPPAAAHPAEPVWPLKVELLPRERESHAFYVTQAGPVKVQLQISGAPVVLSLRRPDGRVVERTGSGELVIDDTATAVDLARGVVWGIGLRAAQEPPPAPLVPGLKPPPARPLATGTLLVQHPAASPVALQAGLAKLRADLQPRLNAQLAQAKAAKAAKAVPPAATNPSQAAQAAHDKQVALQHAALLDRIKGRLPADAVNAVAQRIALRVQGRSMKDAEAQAPMSAAKKTKSDKPTSSTPAPAPVIQGTSVDEASPGAPVLLTGANFGDEVGEVHFIVAATRDLKAGVAFWSAGQVLASMPMTDGIPAFGGYVYLQRPDGQKSALRPFRFVPLYDVAVIGFPLSAQGYPFDSVISEGFDKPYGTVEHFGDPFWGAFFGGKGDEEFYRAQRLANGWMVVDVRILDPWGNPGARASDGTGEATIAEFRPGTNSPFVKVHWWRDPGGYLEYKIQVTVQRPKNLPCADGKCAFF
jgi:hypothetical protein